MSITPTLHRTFHHQLLCLKSYDTTHDNLEDDTHQDIHQVSHQDSTPSAVILHLIPHFQLVQKRILRKRVKHIILDRTA
ncbi:hypothetical protein DWW59_14130 [Firmicutes bacterium AF16-15]|nr:hypothetical protein DWW59_14130 [Firmicutes bacterium AF16-15]RHU29906.1 hypothetical protein DXD76_03220 [Firmicutes bacterium TM09-10]